MGAVKNFKNPFKNKGLSYIIKTDISRPVETDRGIRTGYLFAKQQGKQQGFLKYIENREKRGASRTTGCGNRFRRYSDRKTGGRQQ